MSLLQEYELWQEKKEKAWLEKGISIDKKYDSCYAVQRHMQVSSPFALGEVSYYESNGYYWVDYEALSLFDKPGFTMANIAFSGEKSIEQVAGEFERYMLGL